MTSPISIHVLALLALALGLSYAAGAYCSGPWAAGFLIIAGMLAAVAVFMEASAAYAAGLDDSMEDEA